MEKETTITVLIISLIALAGLFTLNTSTGQYYYGVTLTVSASGKGYVSSYPSGIECGYACSEIYSQGTTITLTAKTFGDSFTGWGGDCSGSSTTCTLTLDSDKTVSANFGSAQPAPAKVQQSKEEITYYQRQPESSGYSKQNIVSHDAEQDYPSACDDYPTMPGCPGEGTNIAPPPPPSIPDVTMTGFEPRKGYERNIVNIEGINLGYVSRVYFNGELVEGFSVTPDGKELQTIVPQGAKTGPIELLLTSGGSVSSDQDFVVWTGVCSNPDVTRAFKQLNKLPQGSGNSEECDATRYVRAYSNYKELRNAIQKVVGLSKLPPPTIGGFRPSPALPGSEVSIIGPSLDVKADEIKFDGKSISFKLIDENEIKITIHSDTVFGEHEITVISDLHGSGSAKIKIIPLPKITHFSPETADPNGEITILGENFYEPEEITFYEINTQQKISTKSFQAISLQEIKVNAPNTAGIYGITINAKNSYVRAQYALAVESKPIITSIEPEDGRLGNNAIIYGSNLKGIKSITLNGNSISYKTDNSETQKTIYVKWGIDNGLVEVKTQFSKAQAQLLSNKNQVTKLITGKEETCFGGVGKGCYGSEDKKEEWGWGSQKIVAPVGCSNEVNGQRNCWVVPGSIKHDNCCARYPGGKMCGGPGKDGNPAGENNHNDKCVSEWDAAFWDVFWWRAFTATFDATKPTDLTPKESSRYILKDEEGNAILSETAETLRLCASAGHELREQSDQGFCCSGSAVNKKCTGGRGVQTLPELDTVTRTDQGADLSTVPIPLAPGEQPTPPIVSPPVQTPPVEIPKPAPTPTPEPPKAKPKPRPRPVCTRGRYCRPIVRG